MTVKLKAQRRFRPILSPPAALTQQQQEALRRINTYIAQLEQRERHALKRRTHNADAL